MLKNKKPLKETIKGALPLLFLEIGLLVALLWSLHAFLPSLLSALPLSPSETTLALTAILGGFISIDFIRRVNKGYHKLKKKERRANRRQRHA